MARYELRYLARHPVRWLAIWWLHMSVAAILAAMAIAWTADVFSPVIRPNLWPVAMGGVAALVLASAIAPFERRLQAITGAALITMGVARAAALVEVWINSDISGPLIAGLALHALLLAAVGVTWPDWTLACGTRVTLEAGREGMGG